LGNRLKTPKENLNRTSFEQDAFVGRVLVAVGITVFVVLLLLFVWQVIDVLLSVFAGILLTVFLRGLSEWTSKLTALSNGWSLAIVVLALVAIIGVSMWLLAPDVIDQVDQLSQSLPQSVQQLRQQIERYEWGRWILAQMPESEELVSYRADVVAGVAGVFSTTLGTLVNVAIILVIGIYVAVEPGIYTDGIIRLVPIGKRERAREILYEVGYTLQWWLIGRVASMAVVGVLTAVGLWLLGVPLALTLGLLAALLTFIPNIGPTLAVVPAALLALLQSPTKSLYVILLYLGVQAVESYLLIPLVQRQTVSLPPALTITAQVLLGILVGGFGLVLAVPLTAAVMVLVRMLYIEDALGDSIDMLSDRSQGSDRASESVESGATKFDDG
jgi:predicted PurR-regulated permease PerM